MMMSTDELALKGQQREQRVPQTRVLHGKEEEKAYPTYPALKRCRLEVAKDRMKNQWTSQTQTQPPEARMRQSHVLAQEEKRSSRG